MLCWFLVYNNANQSNLPYPGTEPTSLTCAAFVSGFFATSTTWEAPDQSSVSVSVQSLSRVWLFATPWTGARHISLPITISRSLPKLMSIVSVIASNHLILCRPLLLLPSIFPSIRVFSNESALHIKWPKYWSFSFKSVLPMNTQDWSPLGLTGWISLQSKGLSRVFSKTQFKSINSSALSPLYSPTLTSIHDHRKTIALTRWTFVDKVMSLLFEYAA